jgi:hypothetical protein
MEEETMGMCTVEGNAAEMADIASDLYEKGKRGDTESQLNFRNVMQGINDNQECSGHDKFVEEAYKELSGPLAHDAVLGSGKRPGYPRLEEEITVSEIYVPPFIASTKDK